MNRILNQKDADKFCRDSAEFTKRVTKTKESARQALIDLGIYTKDGKLTKHYR